jgi:hypothetical protein
VPLPSPGLRRITAARLQCRDGASTRRTAKSSDTGSVCTGEHGQDGDCTVNIAKTGEHGTGDRVVQGGGNPWIRGSTLFSIILMQYILFY